MFLAWGLCVVAMQKARLVGVVKMTASKSTSLTARLGVYGWGGYDALILAALAIEAPVLLIGAHGTAKTLLVERLAEALGGSFRHYNASLINYDDLVGIPYPDEVGGLKFIGSPGSIWGATFTFFDEVNRCRPDLQNKMFPIIHERKVAGVHLPDLLHRWAAMNPPSPVDGLGGGYSGVEPLDLALADRFWLILKVPTWSALTREERAAVVEAQLPEPSETGLQECLRAAKASIEPAEQAYGSMVTRYVVALTDQLTAAGIHVSSRRSALLRRLIISTLAATSALGEALDVSDLLERIVRSGLPHWADPTPPDLTKVLAAHRQSLNIARLSAESHTRKILEESNLLRRVKVALDVKAEDTLLATTVLGALSSLPTDAHKIALSAVLAESLREETLTPAAWSAIAENAARVKRIGEITTQEAPGARMDAWRRAAAWLATPKKTQESRALVEAIVSACGPELIHKVDLEAFIEDVASYLKLFPVEVDNVAK